MSQTFGRNLNMQNSDKIVFLAREVRAYYNSCNKDEPFCIDFGAGSTAMILQKLTLNGAWKFSHWPDANPQCAVVNAGGAVTVELSLSDGSAVISERSPLPAA